MRSMTTIRIDYQRFIRSPLGGCNMAAVDLFTFYVDGVRQTTVSGDDASLSELEILKNRYPGAMVVSTYKEIMV